MPQTDRPSATPARRMAVWLLNGVLQEHQMLSELTGKDRYLELDPADRARALRLATTTLRYMGRADRALRPHLSKQPPDAVQNMLRLGVVEVAHFGAPIHAVTNDLVTLAGSTSRTRPLKGLINAVMRRAIAAVDGKWDKSPVPMLPKWLRKPLIDAYGNGPISAIEVAHMRGAPLDITAKSDPETWAKTLQGDLMPNGTIRLQGGQVSALPGYDTGDWWVQDAAASMAALWAGPQADQTILDLCAAPGGKTMQLAASGAQVTAVDNSEHRMARVQENLKRTDLKARTIVDDVLTFSDQTYDTVLLDAPCSATGTIRRHPDLPYAKDGHGISKLIEVQAAMLVRAADHVKPGGALVFCTCSLIPDEGEVHAEQFLQSRSDFTVDVDLPAGADLAWKTSEGGLRMRPDYWADRGGMDGFYVIRFNRAA